MKRMIPLFLVVGFCSAMQMMFCVWLFNNSTYFSEGTVLFLFVGLFFMAFGAGRIIDMNSKKKKKNRRAY